MQIIQNHKFLAPFLLLLLGILVYSNTAFNPFLFDDNEFIVMNPSIRNLYNPENIWELSSTRFIAFLTFACNYHLHQLYVFGYHLVNIIVHSASAISIYWFMTLIFLTPIMKTDKISDYSDSIAWFVSLIFLVHPLQTESVTYIYQRITSLAGFFYIFSLCLYMKARISQLNNGLKSTWIIFYLLSFFICVFGMFTKESTFTLPFAVVLCEICFFGRSRNAVFRYAMPFLITLLIIPVTLFIGKTYTFVNIQDLYRQPVSGLHYFFTQPRVIMTYLRLLFIPINQNLDYDFHISKTLLEFPVFASLLFLATIIFIAIKLFSKYRLVSFGIFFFFLTLSVESGIIPLYDVIFEHRLYLPMAGFCIFIVSVIFYLWSRKIPKVPVFLLFAMAISYIVLTYSRNEVWKDEVILWNDVIRKSPFKARPYNNRGGGYLHKKEYDKAIADFNQALKLDPGYEKVFNNRGFAYLSKNEYDKAIADFNQALRINPNYAGVFNNRGFAYLSKNEYDKAIADFNQALRINPNYAEVFNNRAIAFVNKKEYDKAIADFSRALDINPNDAEVFNNRGFAYLSKNEYVKALSDFKQVLRIDSSFPAVYYNLGRVHAVMGNNQEAMELYKKALKVDSDFAQIHNEIGRLYYVLKESKNAIKYLEKAIELNPDFAEAYKNLAVIYYAEKEYDLAVIYCDKAVKLGYEVEHGLLNSLKPYRK